MARRPPSGRAEESARLRAPGPDPTARLRLERETDPHMDSALLFTGRGSEPAAVWLFRDPDGSLSLSETASARPRGAAAGGSAARLHAARGEVGRAARRARGPAAGARRPRDPLCGEPGLEHFSVRWIR